jgi:predicted nucleic acid-binding protein
MKNYIFIDTNIFIQLCAQEKDGDKLADLKEIKQLIENKQILLLMPEIVELELRAQIIEKFDAIKKQIGEIKEFSNHSPLDAKIKKDLISQIDKVVEERLNNSGIVQENIELILNSSQTTKIKINPFHICNSYKKFVSNIKPYRRDQKGEIQPDCMIIEALKEFLNDKIEYQLYFCSQNNNDFSIIENGKRKIHPDIQKEFSTGIIYYENLFQMINDKFDGKFSNKQVLTLSQVLTNANLADDIIKSIGITEAVSKASREMAESLSSYVDPIQMSMIKNLSDQLQKITQPQLEQIANFAKLDTNILNSYRDVLKETAEKLNEAYVFQFINKLDLKENKQVKDAK